MTTKPITHARPLIMYLILILLFGFMAFSTSMLQAQQVEPGVTLDYFGNNPSNGTGANGLLELPDGSFYGTTVFNGAYGQGTIFKITSGGNFTKLHDFTGTEGSTPQGNLIQGQDGNLYGTTSVGGSLSGGTVFVLKPDPATGIFDANSVLKTLYNFNSFSTDGYDPQAGLVQDTNGVLYGTTQYSSLGSGTVFSLEPDGSHYQIIHSFVGSDGQQPGSSLTFVSYANKRYLYGTARYGGDANVGTVFRIWPGMHTLYIGSRPITVVNLFTRIYSFSGLDGAMPQDQSGLIQGEDGNLYGTTLSGGQTGNGTVFQLTPVGTLTTLHSFSAPFSNSSNPDGTSPRAGVIQSRDGALYGTTQGGGTGYEFGLGNGGTLYKIVPDPATGIYDAGSVLTTLHNFTYGDGAGSDVPPTQGSDGNFYGTTGVGGPDNAGTIYRVGPVLTGLTPSSFPNSSNAQFSVYGSGFAANDEVEVNGQLVNTFYISSTHLLAGLPTSGIPGSGSVPVRVYDPNINNWSTASDIQINLPQLSVYMYGDYRDSSHNVGVTLEIINTGGGVAQNVTINTSQVGTFAGLGCALYSGRGPKPTSFSNLPFNLGNLASGQNTFVVLLFPSGLKSGVGYRMFVNGTFSGGTFGGTLKVSPP